MPSNTSPSSRQLVVRALQGEPLTEVLLGGPAGPPLVIGVDGPQRPPGDHPAHQPGHQADHGQADQRVQEQLVHGAGALAGGAGRDPGPEGVFTLA